MYPKNNARNFSRKKADKVKPYSRKQVPECHKHAYIYGLNPVVSALVNPKRKSYALKATQNGLNRLKDHDITLPETLKTEILQSKHLNQITGSEAVHQGLVLEVEPLESVDLKAIFDCHIVVVLDQVTDPHNVGAIMRTATAFGAGALITTSRHSAKESAVLAKSAAGALDLLPWVQVTNLATALERLSEAGFYNIGLAEAAEAPLEAGQIHQKVALVLGSEGKGLRTRTKTLCDQLAAIKLEGPMSSLNVSNAAAIALFALTQP